MTAVHDRASIPSAGKAQNTSIQISTSFVGQLLFYVSSTLLKATYFHTVLMNARQIALREQ